MTLQYAAGKMESEREETIMQISSRFTIAIHMMTCMETFKEEHKITSDFLAASINVNPVIIRRIQIGRASCRERV